MPKKQNIDDIDEDDDDDVPLTKAELAKFRPVSAAKKLRYELGLSQVEFSRRFGIPLGTLRDWEQNAAKPDAAGELLLTIIASEPAAVERAVKKRSKSMASAA